MGNLRNIKDSYIKIRTIICRTKADEERTQRCRVERDTSPTCRGPAVQLTLTLSLLDTHNIEMQLSSSLGAMFL